MGDMLAALVERMNTPNTGFDPQSAEANLLLNRVLFSKPDVAPVSRAIMRGGRNILEGSNPFATGGVDIFVDPTKEQRPGFAQKFERQENVLGTFSPFNRDIGISGVNIDRIRQMQDEVRRVNALGGEQQTLNVGMEPSPTRLEVLPHEVTHALLKQSGVTNFLSDRGEELVANVGGGTPFFNRPDVTEGQQRAARRLISDSIRRILEAKQRRGGF